MSHRRGAICLRSTWKFELLRRVSEGIIGMAEEGIVSVELPAPAGWKKYIPKDGTPRRNGVIFISPTGEEIRNRKHLDRFLRSHPGGPSPSDFDWGYGDTPRRSVRIREKVKATESPAKRQRKLNLSEGEQERNGEDGDEQEEQEEQVDDEVPESEKTDSQAVESIVDAVMKYGEDGSVEVKAENNSTELVAEDKTTEEREVTAEDSAHISDEIQEGKDKNELKKLEIEEANKDLPVLSPPDAAEEENSAIKESQVDSKVTPHETDSKKEDLREEEELKDRTVYNNNHSCEQKI